ncbi:MAG TPA: SGNH/GDSL hydrolase family protein [Candidatus Saccharimonadales bacterium]|nr:SGNH/GDSL hydrolase family protein [Candidatus Saccharimonadales bacterium]
MRRIIIISVSILIFALLVVYFVHIIPETITSKGPGQQYIVSLGDSVAAGYGIDSSTSNNSCGQSESAYPILLGKKLNKQVIQLACSGATVAAGKNSLLSQYLTAKPYINNSDVVIYAGANDIGWLQTIISCTQTNCDTNQNRNIISTKIVNLQSNLTSLLNKIQKDKPHRLIVNTYYQLLSNDNNCFSNVGITDQEINFINAEEVFLNDSITSAATNSKATTVNVSFSGHLLCDKQSWIQNVKDNAPLHPNLEGQEQISNQDYLVLSKP